MTHRDVHRNATSPLARRGRRLLAACAAAMALAGSAAAGALCLVAVGASPRAEAPPTGTAGLASCRSSSCFSAFGGGILAIASSGTGSFSTCLASARPSLCSTLLGRGVLCDAPSWASTDLAMAGAGADARASRDSKTPGLTTVTLTAASS